MAEKKYEDEYDYTDIPEEELIYHFTDNALTTKADLDFSIKLAVRDFREEAKKDVAHSPMYYNRILELLDEFKKKLDRTVLFDNLEDWWSYFYEIRETGITLYLQHLNDYSVDSDGSTSISVDTEYELISIKSKLLSADQYAEMYGVGVGTVRQWIRRGKLPSAIKVGSEWRIPELAETLSRDRKASSYRWDDELTDIPDEYAFLPKGSNNHVTIFNKGGHFEIDCFNKTITMDTKEKERFELFLISHPLIHTYTRTIKCFG